MYTRCVWRKERCGGVVVWCGVGCTAVIDYCDIVITNYTSLSSRDVLFTFYLFLDLELDSVSLELRD